LCPLPVVRSRCPGCACRRGGIIRNRAGRRVGGVARDTGSRWRAGPWGIRQRHVGFAVGEEDEHGAAVRVAQTPAVHNAGGQRQGGGQRGAAP